MTDRAMQSVLDTLRRERQAPRLPAILHTQIPYDQHMDVGRAYNQAMERLADDEWAAFLDHDAMFTTAAWYHQIRAAIAAHPDAGAFTAVTNRIGNPCQRIEQMSAAEHDIRVHRERGAELFHKHHDAVIDITAEQPFSGVLIVISKRAWQAVGGFKSGFLGVDTRLHVELQAAGYRIFVMPGLYVYHWYRADPRPDHRSLLGPGDRIPYKGPGR